MNRRGFLSALIGSGLAAAADPERLLWSPGQKLISIPAPSPRLEPAITLIERLVEHELRMLQYPEAPLLAIALQYQQAYNRHLSARMELLHQFRIGETRCIRRRAAYHQDRSDLPPDANVPA